MVQQLPNCTKILIFQADIDLSKRAGELSEEEVDKIVTIMQNPRQYKIPDWFLNRQKDIKDGKLKVNGEDHKRGLSPGIPL